MLVQALEAEVATYLERHAEERDGRGHALVVRNGHARQRKVTLGAGTIEIQAPRVNDRRRDARGERQRFTSSILPPNMRRSPKVAEEKDYVYVWVDGIHFNVRLEDDRLCTLVMIGARLDGTKELVAIEDGYRESTVRWTPFSGQPEGWNKVGRGRGSWVRPSQALESGDEGMSA